MAGPRRDATQAPADLAQPREDAPQGDRRLSKSQRLQEALDDAEEQLLEAEDRAKQLEEQLREVQAENARLKVAADGGGEREQGPLDAENAPAFSIDEIKTIKAAGRRCCMLHMMWMKGDCLFDTDVRNNFDAIIANLEALRSEENDDDAEDATATFWNTTRFRIADPVDVVGEVVSHLDTKLAKRWFEPQFKREFKEGMRKMRSESVNQLADRQHLAFTLTDPGFGERHGAKTRGEAAKELLKDDAYLTEPLKDDNDLRSDDERFLRSPIILRATKLILTSPSSVCKGKKRSAQAGPSRADKWHIKAIIPSILSFICTIVHFVLSGDASFEQVSSKNNYIKMYTDNLEILRMYRRKNRALYEDLIALYNKEVLPNLHPDQPADEPLGSMTSGRRAIYQRLVQQSSDNEEDQQEDQGAENRGREGGNED